jgi:hypothetical protein
MFDTTLLTDSGMSLSGVRNLRTLSCMTCSHFEEEIWFRRSLGIQIQAITLTWSGLQFEWVTARAVPPKSSKRWLNSCWEWKADFVVNDGRKSFRVAFIHGEEVIDDIVCVRFISFSFARKKENATEKWKFDFFIKTNLENSNQLTSQSSFVSRIINLN